MKKNYHLENQYFTTWEIIKFFKWFLKYEQLNLKVKLSINSSFKWKLYSVLSIYSSFWLMTCLGIIKSEIFLWNYDFFLNAINC